MNTLESKLEPYLPKTHDFQVLHVHSIAKDCKHLIASKYLVNEPLKTYKVNHFFTLSSKDHQPVLGIEIYNYITVFEDHTESLFFIAKADTTGLKLLRDLGLKIADVVEGYLKFLVHLDVSQYKYKPKGAKNQQSESKINNDNPTVKRLYKLAQNLCMNEELYKSITSNKRTQLPRDSEWESLQIIEPLQTQIAMFTRPEKQYIFPESFKNINKHKTDGKQLLNWWLKILDNIIKQEDSSQWNCKVIIPGSDLNATAPFYLKLTPNVWSYGSIFDKNSKELAIHTIPLFPDDPKGRFLEHLVAENRYKSTSQAQYWEELGIRQEFRLGILVGIVGCETGDLRQSTPGLYPLKLLQYKLIIEAYKSYDYLKDVSELVKEILQKVAEFGIDFKMVKGTKIVEDVSKTTAVTRALVNNLTGLVKRRKK